MKTKIISVITILSTTLLFSQKSSYMSISSGIDMRNLIVGSSPTQNKPALDWITQIDCVGANVHVAAGYESFTQIKFSRIFGQIGYEIDLYSYPFGNEIRTQFIPAFEASIIKREYTETYSYQGKDYSVVQKPGFMAIGLNARFQWDLTDHFTVGTSTSIMQRPDKDFLYNEQDRWVLSNYFLLTYKFNNN